jgi:mono/diheme cytochrome c family protein
MPELPDFTSAAWQKTRKDTDLAQSILLGRGKFMLPMSDKLGSVDMKQLVALVRRFPGGQVVPAEPPKLPSTPLPPIGQPQPRLVPTAQKAGDIGNFLGKGGAKAEKPSQDDEDLKRRISIGAGIFRQYCFVCHGLDGTGTNMRPTLPPIPDFTNRAFHKEHTDAQLLISILDGKGQFMPANRGRVTEDQAGDLVAYIRTFGPDKVLTTITSSKPSVSDKAFEEAVKQLQDRMKVLRQEYEKTKARD